MSLDGREIPVAFYGYDIRIEITEDRVIDAGNPDIALVRLPVFYFFTSGNNGTERGLGTVCDAGIFRTCIGRDYVLTVYPVSYYNFISRERDLCRLADSLKRSRLTSVTGCCNTCVNIIDLSHSRYLLGTF